MRLQGKPERRGPWASNLTERVDLARLFAPFWDRRRVWGESWTNDLRDLPPFRVTLSLL